MGVPELILGGDTLGLYNIVSTLLLYALGYAVSFALHNAILETSRLIPLGNEGNEGSSKDQHIKVKRAWFYFFTLFASVILISIVLFYLSEFSTRYFGTLHTKTVACDINHHLIYTDKLL